MNNKYEEQLKKLSDIKLTETERSSLDAKILNYLAVHKKQKETVSWIYKVRGYYTLSPYSSDRLASLFYRGTTLALILILVSGGTLTFASTSALPGDFLYPIKVNVNEKIQETLTTSTEKKLVFQEKKIEKRLVEIKTLKSTGQLTAKNAYIAEQVLKQHVEDFAQTANILQEAGKEGVVIATATKLIPVISEYTDTNLGTKESPEETGETTVSTGETIFNNTEDKKKETGIEESKDTSTEKKTSGEEISEGATLSKMMVLDSETKEDAGSAKLSEKETEDSTAYTKEKQETVEKNGTAKTEEDSISENLAKSIQDQTDKISDVIRKVSGELEDTQKEEPPIPTKTEIKK